MKPTELTKTAIELKKLKLIVKAYEDEKKEMDLLDRERAKLIEKLSENNKKMAETAKRYKDERYRLQHNITQAELFPQYNEKGGDGNG